MDLRRRLGWRPDAQIVGMLGRLVRWKGGDAFAEAAFMIAQSNPMAHFVVAGDPILDSERNFSGELQSRVQASGLSARFRLLPFQDDVFALLRNYDILVQPSMEPDPFPLSVIEALACGIPVVAFDHGGVSEIVEDGRSGRLVPPGDVEGLARACLELLDDRVALHQYARAAKTAASRFDAAKMCEDIAQELFAAARKQRGQRAGDERAPGSIPTGA